MSSSSRPWRARPRPRGAPPPALRNPKEPHNALADLERDVHGKKRIATRQHTPSGHLRTPPSPPVRDTALDGHCDCLVAAAKTLTPRRGAVEEQEHLSHVGAPVRARPRTRNERGQWSSKCWTATAQRNAAPAERPSAQRVCRPTVTAEPQSNRR